MHTARFFNLRTPHTEPPENGAPGATALSRTAQAFEALEQLATATLSWVAPGVQPEMRQHRRRIDELRERALDALREAMEDLATATTDLVEDAAIPQSERELALQTIRRITDNADREPEGSA
ncbi:MAG: hypothetical protein JWM77_1254, partial [Rhodospirillales bacterium]|nr:hypothetical protein [Rhodospirillales bacterium]